MKSKAEAIQAGEQDRGRHPFARKGLRAQHLRRLILAAERAPDDRREDERRRQRDPEDRGDVEAVADGHVPHAQVRRVQVDRDHPDEREGAEHAREPGEVPAHPQVLYVVHG
jgi:hypothetical protein